MRYYIATVWSEVEMSPDDWLIVRSVERHAAVGPFDFKTVVLQHLAAQPYQGLVTFGPIGLSKRQD